jgi:hypothetical protein
LGQQQQQSENFKPFLHDFKRGSSENIEEQCVVQSNNSSGCLKTDNGGMVLSQYNPLETHIVNYLCQFFQALQTMKCQHKN